MKNLLYLFIFTGAIIVLIGFSSHYAYAASYTAIGGDWNVPATWGSGVTTVPTPFDAVTIPSGVTVTIPSGLTVTAGPGRFIISQGGTLTNNGRIEDWGYIEIVGTVINNGFINNGNDLQKFPGGLSIDYTGKLINNEFGTLANNAMGKIFVNDNVFDTTSVGEIENSGIIKNDGTLSTYGSILNSGVISNSNEISNAGTIVNSNGINSKGPTNGYIENSGNIDNFEQSTQAARSGGKINNDDASTIKNTGTIDNNKGAINNYHGSIITNTNSITNVDGTINNYCPSIINPMTVNAGNPIINTPCPQVIGDPAILAWIAMISTIVLVVFVGMYTIKHPWG